MTYIPKDGFPYYFAFVEHMDCTPLFSSLSAYTFLNTIYEKKATYRYTGEAWNIKQIVGYYTPRGSRPEPLHKLHFSFSPRVALQYP